MHFFVPHAEDSEQAERVWNSVRAFLQEQGRPTEGRRVQKLSFRHNSRPYALEVGKRFADLGEEVLIILRAAGYDQYYVCAANHGVVRGEPYLVGIDHNTAAVDFDS